MYAFRFSAGWALTNNEETPGRWHSFCGYLNNISQRNPQHTKNQKLNKKDCEWPHVNLAGYDKAVESNPGRVPYF